MALCYRAKERSQHGKQKSVLPAFSYKIVWTSEQKVYNTTTTTTLYFDRVNQNYRVHLFSYSFLKLTSQPSLSFLLFDNLVFLVVTAGTTHSRISTQCFRYQSDWDAQSWPSECTYLPFRLTALVEVWQHFLSTGNTQATGKLPPELNRNIKVT